MNKLRTAFGTVGVATYGWALYVSYWARPNTIWHKVQKLEWEAHVNPSNEVEKELQEWSEWRKLTFLEQLLKGPPRRSTNH